MTDMEQPPDFYATMSAFAAHVAEEAKKPGVKLHDKVKAFEALANYFAALRKGGGFANLPTEGNNGAKRTFSSLRNAVKGADDSMEQ